MRDLPFLLRLHASAPLARLKRTALPRRPLKNIISARYISGDTFINDNAPCFKRFSISDFDYDEILCFLRLACPLPSLFESLDKKFEDSLIPRPFRHHGSLRYRTPVGGSYSGNKSKSSNFRHALAVLKVQPWNFSPTSARNSKKKLDYHYRMAVHPRHIPHAVRIHAPSRNCPNPSSSGRMAPPLFFTDCPLFFKEAFLCVTSPSSSDCTPFLRWLGSPGFT